MERSGRLENEWDAAISHYASVCETGGTPEQRRLAFARAKAALDKLPLEWPDKTDTIRTEAVK